MATVLDFDVTETSHETQYCRERIKRGKQIRRGKVRMGLKIVVS